jgi:hypothetical protein
MSANGEQVTAGACARQLLEALNSGSDEGVQRALSAIADLAIVPTPDSRELELRDLLSGLAEPFARGTHSARAVAAQMLVHVAGEHIDN